MNKFSLDIMGLRPWDITGTSNTLTSVHGTPADAASGYTLVEEYLQKKYLAERSFTSPMLNPKYHTRLTLPKMSGQYMKLTRRKKLRNPEVAKEVTDPLSSAQLQYEQILVPIEFHNDVIGIGTIAQATSWIDMAKDAKELTFEAIRRYGNRYVQAAFVAGRFKPGYRNASGVTVGDSTYPHFWTTPEATVTVYGQSFTFASAPKYYGGDATEFAELASTDYVTMDKFRNLRTRLRNAGTLAIGGKLIAVISESTQADLEKDDEYFAQAIRNGVGQKALVDGHIADYAGFHWVIDDEPWVVQSGGSEVALAEDGDIHYSFVFGTDAFGNMELGGFSSAKPNFKVQDKTATGKLTTMGYLIAFQVAVLKREWCACLLAPVRESGANGDA